MEGMEDVVGKPVLPATVGLSGPMDAPKVGTGVGLSGPKVAVGGADGQADGHADGQDDGLRDCTFEGARVGDVTFGRVDGGCETEGTNDTVGA